MKQKVLLVEHSQPVHALVKSRLSEEPLELFCACSADAALEMASQIKPDLILLDAELPQPGGFDVCRRFKSDPQTTSIPVIFLTGAMSAASKLEGLDIGAVDFIAKPFEAAELRARIRAALRTKYLVDLLASKAMVDGVTGLWNGNYLEQRITGQLATVNRTGRSFACILGDVDNFKSINGRFGRPFGDEVLRAIAVLFIEDCRTEDVVCRCGSDRFAVLTPGVDALGALVLAERLRHNVSVLKLTRSMQSVNVTCSFGIAGADANSILSPLTRAENALAQARSGGGNQVVTAAPAALVPTAA